MQLLVLPLLLLQLLLLGVSLMCMLVLGAGGGVQLSASTGACYQV